MAREQSDTPDLKASNVDAKMWAVMGDGYFPCEESVQSLPAGQYTIAHTQDRGIFFHKKSVNLDDLMTLPDSASQAVLREIETFWTKEDNYRKFKFLWKRGILLWGPPGSGKTSTVQLISKLIIDRGGISVYVSQPKIAAFGLEMMRKIEPKRPIVVMLEDLDAIIGGNSASESDLLALLDGELQIDNVVFIATTNYPEKLDRRIVNRPSRFDLVKKIGMPSAEARRTYILAKEPDAATNMITVVDEELVKSAQALRSKAAEDLAEAKSRAQSLLEELEAAQNVSIEKDAELEVARLEVDQARARYEAAKPATDFVPEDQDLAQIGIELNSLQDLVSQAEGRVQKLEVELEETKAKMTDAVEAVKKIEAETLEAEANDKKSNEIEASATRQIKEVDHWVELTDGFSVAHIKELILAVRCFEQPFGDVIKRLRAMSKSPNSADRDGGMFSR